MIVCSYSRNVIALKQIQTTFNHVNIIGNEGNGFNTKNKTKLKHISQNN